MIRFYLSLHDEGKVPYSSTPPDEVRHLLIKDFTAEYGGGLWGYHLVQELILPDCSCEISYIVKYVEGTLHAVPEVSQFALEHILEGVLTANINSGEQVELGNKWTYFFYLPADVRQEANFNSELVISIHINYTIDFLRKHAGMYPFMADVIRQFEADPKVALSLGPVVNDYPLKQAWKRFYDELRTHPQPARLIAIKAHELLVMYCHLLEEGMASGSTIPKGVKHPEQIRRVNEIIEKDFKSKHLYRDLRAAVGLNEHAMKKEFKLMYGMPVHKKVMELKYGYAYKEILSTSKKIQDIMKEVGYSNFSNFSKTFKERFGVEPRGLRDTD